MRWGICFRSYMLKMLLRNTVSESFRMESGNLFRKFTEFLQSVISTTMKRLEIIIRVFKLTLVVTVLFDIVLFWLQIFEFYKCIVHLLLPSIMLFIFFRAFRLCFLPLISFFFRRLCWKNYCRLFWTITCWWSEWSLLNLEKTGFI